jgi:3-dehydroquinate synthase
MADASIGGKNGINYQDGKNVLGTFSEPLAVLIYPGFLKTLLREELRSGFAEIIKHILISDEIRWNKLLKTGIDYSDQDLLSDLITHSVGFKSKITREDFFDKGKRMILNFGHTIGHALESYSLKIADQLRHGEAVAAGMVSELYLSNKICGFPPHDFSDSVSFIRQVFNDINIHGSFENLLPYFSGDKKNSSGKIAFSLLSSPGKPAGIFYPEQSLIIESIIFMKKELSRTAVQ